MKKLHIYHQMLLTNSKKENMINYRKQCTINIVYIKKYEFAELIVQNN